MELDGLFSVAPFDWKAIGTSILCGSIIGVERQLRGKPVGIRTSSLITLGTYIFIAASLYVSAHMAGPEKVVTDPSRIIGQVITGIGFLGAGVMLARVGCNLSGDYLDVGVDRRGNCDRLQPGGD